MSLSTDRQLISFMFFTLGIVLDIQIISHIYKIYVKRWSLMCYIPSTRNRLTALKGRDCDVLGLASVLMHSFPQQLVSSNCRNKSPR